MYEAKYLQQPVAFEAVSAKNTANNFALRVVNRYGFLGLDHLVFTWTVKSDARSLASGSFNVPTVYPDDAVEVNLDLVKGDLSKTKAVYSTAWVEIVASLKQKTPWASEGHVIATQDLPLDLKAGLKVSKGVNIAVADMAALTLEEVAGEGGVGERLLRIKGDDWDVTIGKSTGKILSYRVKGTSLIEPGEGPEHAFLRALTDNDRAGFPVSATFVTPKGLCEFLEPYTPWKA